MRSTVHSRQSLVDIAVQECGSFEAAFTLGERNGLALTETLEAGTELEYGPGDITNKQVVIGLAVRKAKPATAITAEDAAAAPWGGVGYMGIEIDFIVS